MYITMRKHILRCWKTALERTTCGMTLLALGVWYPYSKVDCIYMTIVTVIPEWLGIMRRRSIDILCISVKVFMAVPAVLTVIV